MWACPDDGIQTQFTDHHHGDGRVVCGHPFIICDSQQFTTCTGAMDRSVEQPVTRIVLEHPVAGSARGTGIFCFGRIVCLVDCAQGIHGTGPGDMVDGLAACHPYLCVCLHLYDINGCVEVEVG